MFSCGTDSGLQFLNVKSAASRCECGLLVVQLEFSEVLNRLLAEGDLGYIPGFELTFAYDSQGS